MRRGLSGTAWVLVLTPLHWLLLWFVAWRVRYQLIVAPYTWKKTEPGLAKTSWLKPDMTRSLIKRERYLTDLENAGLSPAITDAVTYTSANRRPRRRAAA